VAWYLWDDGDGARPLKNSGKVAIDESCCCLGSDCCGRLTPGPTSEEGPEYFPLTLSVTITATGACACPDAPVTATLTWDPTMLRWSNASIPLTGNAEGMCGSEACHDIGIAALCEGDRGDSVDCPGVNWWSITVLDPWEYCQPIGSCRALPLLDENCECDPLVYTCSLSVTGLCCCGSVAGGSLDIKVFE
jgi:hypothetical protein